MFNEEEGDDEEMDLPGDVDGQLDDLDIGEGDDEEEEEDEE